MSQKGPKGGWYLWTCPAHFSYFLVFLFDCSIKFHGYILFLSCPFLIFICYNASQERVGKFFVRVYFQFLQLDLKMFFDPIIDLMSPFMSCTRILLVVWKKVTLHGVLLHILRLYCVLTLSTFWSTSSRVQTKLTKHDVSAIGLWSSMERTLHIDKSPDTKRRRKNRITTESCWLHCTFQWWQGWWSLIVRHM